mmetsp:Transcript_11072/g.18089  ORF Transcript_11072/g.18089 Transcript_11072/m.18089 type:complete len:278 (-) Transcript_11072:260-1093(-)
MNQTFQQAAGMHAEVLKGCGVRGVVDYVDVSGRAKKRHAGLGPLLAEVLDNSISSQGQLDVQVSVQISVVANSERLSGSHCEQEVQDLCGLLGEVTSNVLQQLLLRAALTLLLLQRKEDLSGRSLGGVHQALPHSLRALAPHAGDVNAHHGGAVLQQLVERAHGRPGADEHEVLATQVQLAFRNGADGGGRVAFDGTIAPPLVQLCLELLARQHASLVGNIESAATLLATALNAAHLEGAFRREVIHVIGEGLLDLGDGVDELEVFVHVLASCSGDA